MNMGQAAELSKGLAKAYRAVLAQAEVMEKIASLDDDRDRAIREKDDAVKAKDVAAKEKQIVDDKLKGVLKEEQDAIAVAKDKIEEANIFAENIHRNTLSEHKKLIKEAVDEAKRILKDANAALSTHKNVMVGLMKEKEIATTELDNIKFEIAKLKERLG